jgi:hypothetical protein
MRKFLWYSIIIIFIVVIGYFIKNKIHQNLDHGVNIDNQKWSQKYPQVFNNSGYNNLIESNGILNKLKNNPESLQKLQGKITNEFGIRDDILEYILSLNLNTQANYAAIRMAQSEYLSYFFSNDKITVNNLANKEMLSSFCLMNFVGFNYMHKIHSEIDTKLRNTKERNERMWWVDNNYLGYHVIGTGLSTADEKEKCKRGDY